MFARLSDLAGDAAVVAGDDAEMSARTVAVIRLNHVVEQILFRLVGEIHRRGLAQKSGERSTARLLQKEGVSPVVAHRYVRVGKALGGIPSVAAYGVDGTLSGEHVDSIVKGLNHIERRNPDLPDSDRDDCVRGLLTEALLAGPAAVAERARHMAIVLSPPDKDIPDAENHELNEFTFGTGDDGRSHATLDLDNLLGEKLRVALDPLSKPVPEPDGSPDHRSNAQIRADALERLLDSYLDQENRPTRGGAKPHVVVTVTPEHLQQLQLRGVPGAKAPTLAPAFDRTDTHHIDFWRHGGGTSMINMVLLCRRHHRYIHHRGWEVSIGSDGHPWFIAPGDAGRTAIRANARRTLTAELTAA